MRLYVFLAFLIVCILAVNAAQQNQSNRRTQLAKKKSTNGAVAVKNSNHLQRTKPRGRTASKSKKIRKVKPALKRKPAKKVVRRVVKKSNRRSGVPAKKISRKSGNNRKSIKRGSRGGSRKRLAKQELSDSGVENKSIGAGQANGGDLETSSGDKPTQDANVNQSAAKPVSAPAPVQPAAQPAVQPASTNGDSGKTLLSSPAQGNPLSSSPFNIPKSNGQNQAIGAAFSQSSGGGSAFAAGFASIGKQNTAGGLGQVTGGKKANDPNSENLNTNTAEEPASSDSGTADSGAEEGGSGELAAFRRRPRHG